MTAPRKLSPQEYLALSDAALLNQCEVDHFRASGPGGQKRNKTSSAVRLRHGPTGLASTASDDRSQSVNKTRAVRRLRQFIALKLRTPIDPDTYTPSPHLVSCIAGDGRLVVGRRSEAYPRVVSELLDVLAGYGMRIGDVSGKLGVSTAHLVKFIQKDPKFWQRVNELREKADLKPLR